jgi:hypothetical protein
MGVERSPTSVQVSATSNPRAERDLYFERAAWMEHPLHEGLVERLVQDRVELDSLQ